MLTNPDLTEAIEILKQGGVVVIPTETAYGLAADATNPIGVKRIYAIKGRDMLKTPPLIVASQEMAEQFMLLSPKLLTLAQIHWPGALTIVAKAKPSPLAPSILREDGTIALRVSSHPIACTLSEAIEAPLVATSANRSGEPECYSLADVKNQLRHHPIGPDGFVDCGVLKGDLPSTIIKEENGEIVVLRQGEIHV